MAQKEYFALGTWLELANDVYAESKELMYKMLSTKRMLHIPAYLLHWSIELYLKAFLMNQSKFPKIHDLNRLFKLCLVIDPNLANLCLRTPEVPYDQSYWIDKINPYGEEGGLRYLNKNRLNWSFQVTIYDFLDDMVDYIKRNVDTNKDITQFL
jgi:hypothetical protein